MSAWNLPCANKSSFPTGTRQMYLNKLIHMHTHAKKKRHRGVYNHSNTNTHPHTLRWRRIVYPHSWMKVPHWNPIVRFSLVFRDMARTSKQNTTLCTSHSPSVCKCLMWPWKLSVHPAFENWSSYISLLIFHFSACSDFHIKVNWSRYNSQNKMSWHQQWFKVSFSGTWIRRHVIHLEGF